MLILYIVIYFIRSVASAINYTGKHGPLCFIRLWRLFMHLQVVSIFNWTLKRQVWLSLLYH